MVVANKRTSVVFDSEHYGPNAAKFRVFTLVSEYCSLFCVQLMTCIEFKSSSVRHNNLMVGLTSME
jgi:hypothetical protein